MSDPYTVAMDALRERWHGEETPATLVGWIFDALQAAGCPVATDDATRREAVAMVGMVFADLSGEGVSFGAVVSHVLRVAGDERRAVQP